MTSNKLIATGGLLAAVLAAPFLVRGQGRTANLSEATALLAGPVGGHGGLANASKTLSQGYLGLAVRGLSESDAQTLHLKSTHGAQVTMVDHDGPACKAGLRERDVILSMNGVTVENDDQVRHILHEMQPGRTVSLIIVRAGAEQTVNAVMANREELEREAWEKHWVVPQPAEDVPVSVSDPAPSTRSRFGSAFMGGSLLPLPSTYTGAKVDIMGAQLADYFGVKDGRGLLVHDVDANSPAAQAGLRAGDVVTRINTVPVATKAAWMHVMRESKGHHVSLTVMRDRHEQTLTMLVDPKHHSEAGPPPAPPEADSASTLL